MSDSRVSSTAFNEAKGIESRRGHHTESNDTGHESRKGSLAGELVEVT
jgi:hypothetical protein